MLKKSLPLAFVLLLASLVLGCNGADDGGTTANIELVPQRADMLVYVDLAWVTESEGDILQFSDVLPEDPESQQILDAAPEILSNLDEGIIFAEVSTMSGDDPYLGIIASGNFVKTDLIDAIESASDEALMTYDVDGYTVYGAEDSGGGIVFLSSSQLAVGTTEVLEDIIAVKSGEQSAVSGTVVDTYNNLSDATIRLAIAIPPGTIADALEGDDGQAIPLDTSAFEDLETVGLSADDRGETIALDMQLCFSNSASATEAEGMITSLAAMASFVPGLPAEVGELLGSLDTNAAGTCLGIDLETTEAQLEALFQSLVQVDSEEFSF